MQLCWGEPAARHFRRRRWTTQWRRKRQTLDEMLNNNVAAVAGDAEETVAIDGELIESLSHDDEHPVHDGSIENNESESELSEDENERCLTDGI